MKALTEYRKKRDFKKTPEPGAVVRRGKRAPKEHASFVVQEHHASHLHYDFRLEVDGVLKSWAVPKGPVMDRKVKRLAVEVEDHPLAYGSFHGRIPKGEYGAGEVFIWDKGTWEPKGDPRAALKKGHLDFTLNGGKLTGDWMLIRTRNAPGGKNQWLLMYRGHVPEDIALTHPDKIVYRKEKLTKRDVADYYTAAAARLLPHLAGRPLTLVRCPDGTAGACFYQKHRPSSLPASVKELTLPKGMKGQKDLMAVDGLEGLLALVQHGSFEFHVANARALRLDRPDQIVMDLDPDPSVPWAKVKSAAFELRSLLRTLGLESFVKVTGGKGIHVHVPFEPRYGWTEVKSFARAVAEELASRDPDLYLTKMSKAARKGRIFIDYLRNDAHATAVLPYSLRARKVSAVALPVSWRELPTIRGGDEFDLRAATARLKQADPWRDFFKTRQRIALLEGKKRPALKTPKLPAAGPRRGRPPRDRAAERSR